MNQILLMMTNWMHQREKNLKKMMVLKILLMKKQYVPKLKSLGIKMIWIDFLSILKDRWIFQELLKDLANQSILFNINCQS